MNKIYLDNITFITNYYKNNYIVNECITSYDFLELITLCIQMNIYILNKHEIKSYHHILEITKKYRSNYINKITKITDTVITNIDNYNKIIYLCEKLGKELKIIDRFGN